MRLVHWARVTCQKHDASHVPWRRRDALSALDLFAKPGDASPSPEPDPALQRHSFAGFRFVRTSLATGVAQGHLSRDSAHSGELARVATPFGEEDRSSDLPGLSNGASPSLVICMEGSVVPPKMCACAGVATDRASFCPGVPGRFADHRNCRFHAWTYSIPLFQRRIRDLLAWSTTLRLLISRENRLTSDAPPSGLLAQVPDEELAGLPGVSHIVIM